MSDESSTKPGTPQDSPSQSSASPSGSFSSRLPVSPAEMWSGRALTAMAMTIVTSLLLFTDKLKGTPWYGILGAYVMFMVPPSAYVSIGKAAVTGLLDKLPGKGSGK